MNTIFINSERVGRAGAEVVAVSGELDREIAGLHESLEQIRGGWSSDEAAPRFAAILLDYLDEAAALKRSLTDQGHALVGSGRMFAEAESSIADGFRSGRATGPIAGQGGGR